MFLPLVLLFIVVPIVEIYVIIQVGQAIGPLWTILLLIADAVIGARLLSWQGRQAWRRFQEALAAELAQPVPCFMCAETPWQKCHRRLIAELLTARGVVVTHLVGPGRREAHRLYDESEIRAGKLYLCGQLVA